MASDPAIRLPAGVRDFLPRAAARRRAIAERLLAAFEAWGYARIITPVFECADVLERGLGADARATVIRFVEPGSGEVVALRPDITPQVARLVATRMRDLDGPLRLCYEGAVNRLAGPRGQREILQTGIELIDADSPDGDAEALAVAAAALVATGLEEVRLDVGHVAPVRQALAAIADEAQRARVRACLARKDRAGAVRAAAGLPASLRAIIEALPTLFGAPAEVLRRAGALSWPPLQAKAVAAALATVADVLARAGELMDPAIHANLTIDLGEVRGFEYYTGIHFAGYAPGVGDAVLRGGRYDELIGRYGGAAHATGFAVDIEAVALAQRAAGIDAPPGPPAVLVVASAARRLEGARVAAALRAAGFRAALDLGGGVVGGIAAYARGVGFACVLVLDGERGGGRALRLTSDAERPVGAAVVRQGAAGQVAALAAALELSTGPQVARVNTRRS